MNVKSFVYELKRVGFCPAICLFITMTLTLSFLLSLGSPLKLVERFQEVRDAIIELLVFGTKLIGLRLGARCRLGLTTAFNLLKRGAECLVIAFADGEELSVVCFHGFAHWISMDTLL